MQLYKKIINYLKLIRFDKPIGTILLLNPTLWGLWVASKGMPDHWILFVFVIGVFVMRSVGCVINDLLDRNFDGQVERTKNRPLVTSLPADRVTIKEASIIIIILLFIALCLVVSLNNEKLLLHSIVALLLACIYPTCKRFFACPQFVLGVAFSYAIPMAFVAINKETSLVTWLLYSASLILTVIYDSFYAMVDINGDQKLGLRSSAIWFGQYDILIIIILQGLFLINLTTIGYLAGFSAYYCFLFIVVLLFGYQIKLVRSRESPNFLKAFKNNAWVGFMVFLGFFIEYY